jgi:hypothetical protein
MPEEQDNQIKRRDSAGISRRSETARRGSDAAGFVRGLAKRETTVNRPTVRDQDLSVPNGMSAFEEDVERALVSRGYQVHRYVLVVDQRIDLAIVSKDGRRYELGIKCKGPPYHSQPTLFSLASEAQRVKTLREEGWSIHKIESKEWFLNPEHEFDKLEAMLNKVRLDS